MLFYHLILYMLVAATAPLITNAQRPTATIGGGRVVGTSISVPGAAAPRVNEYLGVPFAISPPVRFAPPVPPRPFKAPYDASARKASCIQQFAYPEASRNLTMSVFNNPPPPSESEDCLYLNIFSPAAASPNNKKPVLFWIYGGNLQFGYGGLQFYDGSSFAAKQDVVVVAINYRTNVFGFPGAPQIPVGKQNVGFLDQRRALTWVQNNIAAFGGDPSKVTIFGESAGGFSVKQLLALPPKPLPFRAAIMESQATLPSTEGATANWNQFAQDVGCGNSTGAAQLACVRKVPTAKIKNVIDRKGGQFTAVLDGKTASTDATKNIEAGTAAKVPFMIGTNADEGSVFILIIADMTGVPVSELTAQNIAKAFFPGASSAVINQIVGAFPAEESALDVANQLLTLVAFQCPAKALANDAASKGYDVWRYYYAANFTNFQPFFNAGVFHSAEIPAVFDTFSTVPGLTVTAREKQISKYMQTAWANFAKNPSKGPQSANWPKLGSTGNDMVDVGGKNLNGGTAISQNSIDTLCPLVAPLGSAAGL